MTFEEAMAAIKDAHAVHRACWGRKKQDCYLLDAKAMEATDWIIADHDTEVHVDDQTIKDAKKALLVLRTQPHPSMLRVQQDALIQYIEWHEQEWERLKAKVAWLGKYAPHDHQSVVDSTPNTREGL